MHTTRLRNAGLHLAVTAFVLALALALGLPEVSSAQQEDPRNSPQQQQQQAQPAAPPNELDAVTTDHVLEGEDQEFPYRATAGQMLVSGKEDEPPAKVFYIAYELKREEGAGPRPVTFAFNGGPGASSVWLHMGVMGPRRVAIGPNAELPRPPVGYESNPLSWLRFTDLVFVDPVGTGYSRSVQEKNPKKQGPRPPQPDKRFWGVKQDVKHMASFIRLYMSRNQRWQSPVFLVGESYGTTRAAALSRELLDTQGIALNGLVLVSPVLDFNTIMAGESNLPFGLFLPSYAATAVYHGKAPGNLDELPAIVDKVEDFVEQKYLPALFLGDALQPERRDEIFGHLAELTGLSPDFVQRSQGRIRPWAVFKNLLRQERHLVGRMDGTITAVDPEPGSPYPDFDPSLEGLLPAFASSFNAYVRSDLDYKNDLAYEILNPEVERNWDWSSGVQGKQGYVLTSGTLRETMSMNPAMQVWVATGYYDLATPYYAGIYTVRQMELDPALRENLRLDIYHGGHMLYTHQQAREAFCADAAAFYDAATQ